MRDLISLSDLDDAALLSLVRLSIDYSLGAGTLPGPLAGRIVATHFQLTSTRTRTAFSAGAMRLGASVLSYGPHDLQLQTGETPEDTGRVLGQMVDAVVIRSPVPIVELRRFSACSAAATINAMSSDEHPTQAIGDLSAMWTTRGDLTGVRVLYLGEGNSTAVALVRALARVPQAHLEVITPEGYGLSDDVVSWAASEGAAHGATVVHHHDADRRPERIDFVYTTQWRTTGTSSKPVGWEEQFAPYQVTTRLLDDFPGAWLMHDLPARRGEEIEAAALDGPRSIAFVQARHKLFGAMAVLKWCVAE